MREIACFLPPFDPNRAHIRCPVRAGNRTTARRRFRRGGSIPNRTGLWYSVWIFLDEFLENFREDYAIETR